MRPNLQRAVSNALKQAFFGYETSSQFLPGINDEHFHIALANYANKKGLSIKNEFPDAQKYLAYLKNKEELPNPPSKLENLKFDLELSKQWFK